MKPLPDPWYFVPGKRNDFKNPSPWSNAKKLEHWGSVGTWKPRSGTRKLWQKSVRKHVEIPPCDYSPVTGEKTVWSAQFHVPHLLQHRQPQSGGKAKVTLVSLGLSFNNLMFPPLRQVMKTSTPGTQDCSMILQKDKSRPCQEKFHILRNGKLYHNLKSLKTGKWELKNGSKGKIWGGKGMEMVSNLWVHVCVCVYIRMHLLVCVQTGCACRYVRVCMHTYAHKGARACMRTPACVCAHVGWHMCVCASVYTRMCVPVCLVHEISTLCPN